MALSRERVLRDHAHDVGWRYFGYEQYGSRQRALAALRRRAPGHARSAYERAFDRSLALWTRARRLLEPYGVRDPDLAALGRELARAVPSSSAQERRNALEWCWYWYHLR